MLFAIVRMAFNGKKTASILEIGSWAGASVITMDAALRETTVTNVQFTCVDSWNPCWGSEDTALHYKLMEDAAGTGAIRRLFNHNLRTCGVKEARIIQALSREVLPTLKEQSFDFIYVDGSHTMEDVLYDLKEAARLVRQGGLICGDDFELRREEIDISHHLDALARRVDFVRDPKTGLKYHPGVTEAVSIMFGEVWRCHGLWCVRQSSEGWDPPDFNVDSDELSLPAHLAHAVEVPYGLYKGYEVYELEDLFVAYPTRTPFPFQQRLIQPSLEGLILLIEAVWEAGRMSRPYLVESIQGVNIVQHGERFWVVPQSIGAVDFDNEMQIGNLITEHKLFEVETIEEGRQVIYKFVEQERSAECRMEALERRQEAWGKRLEELAGQLQVMEGNWAFRLAQWIARILRWAPHQR